MSTVQYSTVQYSTVQYSAVQYSTVQYSAGSHLATHAAAGAAHAVGERDPGTDGGEQHTPVLEFDVSSHSSLVYSNFMSSIYCMSVLCV